MRTPEEAYAYLTTLRQILPLHRRQRLQTWGRKARSGFCDANVSVRLRGSKEFGTKVEVKNLKLRRARRADVDGEQVGPGK